MKKSIKLKFSIYPHSNKDFFLDNDFMKMIKAENVKI